MSEKVKDFAQAVRVVIVESAKTLVLLWAAMVLFESAKTPAEFFSVTILFGVLADYWMDQLL